MAKLQIDDNRLISLVQVNSSLYDRNSSQYKDAVLKDHAWTAISKALNLPKVVCKSRWTIIRQRYSRVKRQLSQPCKKSTESGSARRSSAWRLYENLHFLNSHILPRCSAKRVSSSAEMKQECEEAAVEAHQEVDEVKPDVFQFGLGENGEVKCKVGDVESSFGSRTTNPADANNESNGGGGNKAVKTSDVSFGEFIAFELASFKSEFSKDVAKQNIVNIIYKYKNRV